MSKNSLDTYESVFRFYMKIHLDIKNRLFKLSVAEDGIVSCLEFWKLDARQDVGRQIQILFINKYRKCGIQSHRKTVIKHI